MKLMLLGVIIGALLPVVLDLVHSSIVFWRERRRQRARLRWLGSDE
jgi:hypothetical protein